MAYVRQFATAIDTHANLGTDTVLLPPGAPLTAGPAQHSQVLVIGAGPAGWAVAAACADAAMTVTLVDTAPDRPLPNTYGLWVDEVDLPARCFARTWSHPLVYSDAHGERALKRTYGHLDNMELVRWLRGRLEGRGGRVRLAAVTHVAVDDAGAVATLDHGEPLTAEVVIDCTGSAQRFLEVNPPPTRGIAWQTAFGIVADADGIPWDEDQMVLMDFRSVSTPQGEVPSFLYAMPLGGQRILLEETVLAAVPPVSLEALQARLNVRLASMGISVRKVHHIEDVRIPMNAPLPRIPQPVVGFGAAAGFVHPATGYSVGRSLALAPIVADAISKGLADGGPAVAAREAWRVVQSVPQRRAYRLARSGLQALLSFGPDAMGEFMHHFFAMPQPHWAAYLSGRSAASSLVAAMFRLAGHLPFVLMLQVTHAVVRRGVIDLIYGLVPGLETDARTPS